MNENGGKKGWLGFWGILLLTTLVVGCGPTRKEYAINEALLVDQTRTLEDQLYRAHFQIQRLEGENARLKERLAAKGEKVEEESPSSVPFDPNARPNTREATPSQTGYYPNHPNQSEEMNLSLPITQNRRGNSQPVRMAQTTGNPRVVSGQNGTNQVRAANPLPPRIRNGKQNYAVRSTD